jgi:hypothetical protein
VHEPLDPPGVPGDGDDPLGQFTADFLAERQGHEPSADDGEGPLVVRPEDEGSVPPPQLFAAREGGRLVELPALRVEAEAEAAEASGDGPADVAAPTRRRPRLPQLGLYDRLDRFIGAPQRHQPPAATTVAERLRDHPPTDRLVSWIVTLTIVALGFGIRLYDLSFPNSIIFDETYYAKDAYSLLVSGYERHWIDGANEIITDGDYYTMVRKIPSDDGDKDESLQARIQELCPSDGSFCDWNTLKNDPLYREFTDESLITLIDEQCPTGLETCTWNGHREDASFIVHPPVGKWLIALGEKIFGFNSFGWRFPSCVFGGLLILGTIRLARRLTRSTLIAGLAGLLLCVDGLAFVMSRIALLDGFQAAFLVFAVAAVVADRDYFRARLADRIEARGTPDLEGASGGLIFRPWLLVAGLMFGLACATKWNSMYTLAVFGLLVVAWSVSARRLAGARNRRWDALWLDGVPAFFSMVVLALGVYIASWWRWFATQGGYDRGWGASHPEATSVKIFGAPLASLWHYTVDTYNFHTGDGMAAATHTYRANPFGWLLLARPICFDSIGSIQPGDQGCTADAGETCLRTIYAQGTPLLWWLAALALVAGIVWWLAGADWRFGVTSLATLSTWVPWLTEVGGRPLFFFYAITMIPFLVIGLAMTFGVILGPSNGGRRRFRGAIIVGTLTALIVVNFAFFYPIFSDGVLSHDHWTWRMWFSSWI